MKCNRCSKSATLHITEIEDGVPSDVHLCEDCAKVYLQQDLTTTSAGAAMPLPLPQGDDEPDLECPRCGITFAEFRRTGRLGCADDYDAFAAPLSALYENVHGASEHVGKAPQHGQQDMKGQQELIRLRQELRQAVVREEYEHAAEIRDAIKQIEGN